MAAEVAVKTAGQVYAVQSWDGTCGSALYCLLPLTTCLREAVAPAAALAFEDVANVTLFLKVKGFSTSLSEEDAHRRVNVEEAAVKDEQENVVAGGYSKPFLFLQAVLAQDAQCFCLWTSSYSPHILGETFLLHWTFQILTANMLLLKSSKENAWFSTIS